ncbi:MAG TPA: hypothetical protein VFC78_21045 [Tepidisphaeraceae bacterium]|nr:hypothetical protein [Tepidisphaeraceae bacterium]
MQGVTTAIVALIFACVVWPHLVKNRTQFYAAIALVLGIIVFDCISHMSQLPAGTPEVPFPNPGPTGLQRFCYVVEAFLQMAAILVLVMCTGGQTLGELAGEMHKTIDVVRRGGEAVTLIVPLKGEQPRPRGVAAPRAVEDTSIPME